MRQSTSTRISVIRATLRTAPNLQGTKLRLPFAHTMLFHSTIEGGDGFLHGDALDVV